MGSERNIRRKRGWSMLRIRSIAAFFLAVILLAGAAAEDAHAGTYAFKSTTIYADGTRTASFTCNGMKGLCCDAGAYSTYRGTAALSRLKNTSDAARCAYYYGYRKGWTSGSRAHKLARLLSYCRGNGTGGDYKTSTMKSLLKAAKKQTVPAGFECWLCKPKGNSKQDFIVWKFPKGKLKVVKKSSRTSISGKGSYSLAGITIKVYSDAACKKCVKTLTTKKDGSTGGAFSLPVGTYYVKETKVPEKTGFKLDPQVRKAKVPSGKTVSVGVSNEPDTGSVTIRKKTTGKGGQVQGFRFILTSRLSGKKYTMTTGEDGTASLSGLPFGKYTLVEDLTEDQQKTYTDRTGPRTLTLAKGASSQNITVDWENEYEPKQRLKILKRTGDGGPVAGFAFRISWLLFNSRQITEEEIVQAAQPQAELAEGEEAGAWQAANQKEIDAINEAAKEGRTGSYEVTLESTVTPAAGEDGEGEGEDNGNEDSEDSGGEDGKAGGASGHQIQCSVEIELLAEGDIAEEEREDAPHLTATKEVTETSEGRLVTLHDLRFRGAADRGEETGETDESGQYVMNHVQPGEYTVTEEMTEEQKLRYRQPQTQTKTVEAESDEIVLFSFENEPILIPVRLQKTSADGRIENIEFTLTGTPDYGTEPMEKIVVHTDGEGIADFGSLYPGSYHIEETGFDPAAYADPYPEEGRDLPGFSFRISGDELTQEEIEEGRSLWLGGKPGEGQASSEQVKFRNIPYVDLLLTKVDGITGSFLPGAEFRLEGSDGRQAARFRIDENSKGEPDLVLLETDGVVTGEFGGEQAVGSSAPVVIGQDAAAEENGEEKTEQPPYVCAAIHGLKEGEIYTLTEIEAPQGFNRLEAPYRFSVTLDDNGDPRLNTCDEYGRNIAGSEEGDLLVVVNDGPSIGTECLDDATGSHTAKAGDSVSLTDMCAVTNLAAGQTYTLIARLMDTTEYRTSGRVSDVRPVQGNDGQVTGKITFTAEGGETVIGVPIQAEGTNLAGKTTVAYESLYQGDIDIGEAEDQVAAAEETDPDNENQQVTFEGPGPGKSPGTGNRFPWVAFAVSAAAAAVMAGMGRRVCRRR